MIYYNIDNLIVDLDGTLISKELSKKAFEEIYSRAIARLEEKGTFVAEEYKTPNFYNFRKISKEVKEFIPLFLEEYERIFEKFKDELEREKDRAQKIYEFLLLKYKPKNVCILTANSKGKDIARIILPNIPEDNVIIVNGVNYEEEKRKFLEKLEDDTLYVADDIVDEKIAKEAGVEFLNIREVEKELFKNI